MGGKELDERVIEAELKGKTLLVYYHLLRLPGKKVGVRELQRALKLSSPSVALYHLNKLESLGLVKRDPEGDYVLVREAKVGILKQFARLGRFMVPRFLFYSVLFTAMLATYLLLYEQTGTVHNVVALIFGALASAAFWYETYRLLKEKLF
jgi:DNA-binding transcriptional ArsR family regulator